MTVFPNPVEGEFNVVLPDGIAAGENIQGEIVNESGQTVFVSERLQTEEREGRSIVAMQPEGLSPGIYFVMLYSEEKTIGTSMFVVK